MTTISAGPDRDAAVALLEASGLPFADLTPAHLQHFFCTGAAQAPTGLVGLELRGTEALLRSLAVAESVREGGLGSALVVHAEQYARVNGIRAIYLLTTTAEEFFARRGYVRTERAAAPQSIRTTREFADLCPARSAFMVKHLSQSSQV